MEHDPDLESFLALIDYYLSTKEVQSMGQWRHHFDITTFDHSIFVAYMAYRLAPRFGVDRLEAARAGLLHDLYLYEPYNKNAHPGNQCFYHPVAALQNARALVPDLSPQEENSILTHMWPLARHMPRCRLAILINLSDKLCATLEILHIYHLTRLFRRMPRSVYRP